MTAYRPSHRLEPLAMTDGVIDRARSKFGIGALRGGSATTAVNVLPATAFTIECWLRAPMTMAGTYAALASEDTIWLGTSNSALTVSVGCSGLSAIYLYGPPIGSDSWRDDNSDGGRLWHHVAVTAGPSGIALFLNGWRVAASPVPLAGTSPTFASPFNIRRFHPAAAEPFHWNGSVEEVAIFAGIRYTGSFTPEPRRYEGGEAGLLHLYHLDDLVGADSAINIIPPDAPEIFYSPYNWHVARSAATSWNPGAYLRTLFSGDFCMLMFDVSNNRQPLSQLWWRVDNGPWLSCTVAEEIVCEVPAATRAHANLPIHRLEVVFKAMDCGVPLNRWNAPSATAICLTGIMLDNGATLTAPGTALLNILVFGDSLVEGIRTVGDENAETTGDNDAMFSWAFELGRLLGAEIGIVGWGGTGFTNRFGNVPPVTVSYAFLAQGIPRVFDPEPDLIICNHGANDGILVTDTIDVSTPATMFLDAVLAACPNSKVALLGPLPPAGVQNTSLERAAAACVTPDRVRYIAIAGFFDASKGIDNIGLHPSGANSAALIGPQIAAAIRPMLNPCPQSRTRS